MDIIVTTPKAESLNSALEAKSDAKYWFRKLPTKPKNLQIGDRIYYVEHNNVVGYAIVVGIQEKQEMLCSTTGRDWGSGTYLIIDANSWTPIPPVAYKGFRGFRYYNSTGTI